MHSLENVNEQAHEFNINNVHGSNTHTAVVSREKKYHISAHDKRACTPEHQYSCTECVPSEHMNHIDIVSFKLIITSQAQR